MCKIECKQERAAHTEHFWDRPALCGDPQWFSGACLLQWAWGHPESLSSALLFSPAEAQSDISGNHHRRVTWGPKYYSLQKVEILPHVEEQGVFTPPSHVTPVTFIVWLKRNWEHLFMTSFCLYIYTKKQQHIWIKYINAESVTQQLVMWLLHHHSVSLQNGSCMLDWWEKIRKSIHMVFLHVICISLQRPGLFSLTNAHMAAVDTTNYYLLYSFLLHLEFDQSTHAFAYREAQREWPLFIVL